MRSQFIAETLARKPQLFNAILAFNKNLHVALIPGELAQLGPVGEQLWKDTVFRHAYPTTSQLPTFWNFADEVHRLILLDDDTLHKLGLYFSAAVHGELLAHTLDRSSVSRLHVSIGKDVYAYALKRGRFQIGSLRSILLAQTQGLPLDQRIISLAQSTLIVSSATLPEKLRIRQLERIINIFRSSSDDETIIPQTLPQLNHEQMRTLWFTFKKLLIKEVAPQWAPCFD